MPEQVGQLRLRIVASESIDSDGQLSLPLEREARIDLVRGFVDGPPIDGLTRVMRRNVGKLLETIELNTTSDGCRLLQDVLAAKCDTDERNLRRWIEVAGWLGVLTIVPTFSDSGRREKSLVVNWDCVRRLGETASVHGPRAEIGEAASAHDPAGELAASHGASQVAEGRAPVNRRAGPHFEPRPPGEGKMSGPPDILSGSPDIFPPLVNTQDVPIEPIRVFTKDPIDVPVRASTSRAPVDAREQNCPVDRTKCPPRRTDSTAGSVGTAVDRCPLSLETLQSAQGLARWYAFALGRGWVREIDRLRVFTLAHSVARREREFRGTSRAISNPPGAFVSLVKHRRWEAASHADEDWARKAISWLESEGLL